MPRNTELSLTVQLFDSYQRWQARVYDSFPQHRALEARRRLVQLEWILEKVRETEVRRTRGEGGVAHNPMLGMDILEEVRFFTESFYYFGWRAREILRSLPGLGSVDGLGLRNVRNHLLEHPEKQSKVFVESFIAGGPEGPVLKGLRLSHQADLFPDSGLYVNAAEFFLNVTSKLQELIPQDGIGVSSKFGPRSHS